MNDDQVSSCSTTESIQAILQPLMAHTNQFSTSVKQHINLLLDKFEQEAGRLPQPELLQKLKELIIQCAREREDHVSMQSSLTSQEPETSVPGGSQLSPTSGLADNFALGPQPPRSGNLQPIMARQEKQSKIEAIEVGQQDSQVRSQLEVNQRLLGSGDLEQSASVQQNTQKDLTHLQGRELQANVGEQFIFDYQTDFLTQREENQQFEKGFQALMRSKNLRQIWRVLQVLVPRLYVLNRRLLEDQYFSQTIKMMQDMLKKSYDLRVAILDSKCDFTLVQIAKVRRSDISLFQVLSKAAFKWEYQKEHKEGQFMWHELAGKSEWSISLQRDKLESAISLRKKWIERMNQQEIGKKK